MKYSISLIFLLAFGAGVSLLNVNSSSAVTEQFQHHDTKLQTQILEAQLSQQTPSTQPTPSSEQPLLPTRTEPLTTIKVTKDKTVSVRLINQTSDPIIYIAIGDTSERRLQPKSSVLLSNLNLPASINCYYKNKATFEKESLQAQIKPDNSKGVLDVTLTAGSADADSTSVAITIGRQGGVRLN